MKSSGGNWLLALIIFRSATGINGGCYWNCIHSSCSQRARVPLMKNFINYQAELFRDSHSECGVQGPRSRHQLSHPPFPSIGLILSFKVFMATTGGEIYIKIVNFSSFSTLPSSGGSRTLLFMLLIIRSGTSNMFNMRFMLFRKITWLRDTKAKPRIVKG